MGHSGTPQFYLGVSGQLQRSRLHPPFGMKIHYQPYLVSWISAKKQYHWIGPTSQNTGGFEEMVIFCTNGALLCTWVFVEDFRQRLHWSHLHVGPAPPIKCRVMLLTGHTCVWGPRTNWNLTSILKWRSRILNQERLGLEVLCYEIALWGRERN